MPVPRMLILALALIYVLASVGMALSPKFQMVRADIQSSCDAGGCEGDDKDDKDSKDSDTHMMRQCGNSARMVCYSHTNCDRND